MENPPKHLAVILDGNRRYAKKLNIPIHKGHERGFGKIRQLLEWCVELGIKEVTLYCFSTENFKRDKKEINYLFELFRQKVRDFRKDKLIHEKKVRIGVIGRLSMFPGDMQKEMRDIMEMTKNYNDYKLNLAMGYGGRSEIVDAFRGLLKEGVKEVDERIVKEHLYLADDVDLLIRPGGEHRISNFLLWQSSYAEIHFCDSLWPEFEKKDLVAAVRWFNKRGRRFGE
jgi:tritrans,polycis-undecaprenyl-diphosphate synthase [geranylgeranyl-diphosphate specific]